MLGYLKKSYRHIKNTQNAYRHQHNRRHISHILSRTLSPCYGDQEKIFCELQHLSVILLNVFNKLLYLFPLFLTDI